MVIDARVRLPDSLRPSPEAVGSSLTADYRRVLGDPRAAGSSAAGLLGSLEAAGVDMAVVHAEHEGGDVADALNEAVAELVSAHRSRLAGFGTVSLERPRVARMLAQLERVAALGLLGVNLQPAFFGLALDDRRLWPVYAKAAELGLVVALHTGINYSRAHPIAGEHPLLLDDVLGQLPELRVIACHAAWPWTAELAALARRHPTLYMDFGALAPRYLLHPAGGWSVLMQLGNSLLRDQLLFASDWPLMDIAALLEEWRGLDIHGETRDAALGANAGRLLGLETAVRHEVSV